MTNPIRILHVFGRLNMGGAQSMIMNIYRTIDRKKIQFDFVIHTENKCDFEDEIIALGGKIYRVPRYSALTHFDYISRWNQLLTSNKTHKIIHGHMRSTASIYLFIAKKNNLIAISHSHSTSSGSGFSKIVKKIYQFPLRYISNYMIACSIDAGKWLYGQNIEKDKRFYILKNGIATEDFVFDNDLRIIKRTELNLTNEFVVGHIGRFHHSKNHIKLLKIFKEIKQREKNASLLLIGDGELRKKIEKKARELNIYDSVIFTGSKNPVSAYYHAMDVFVLPSLYEGLGIVAIEAQASGLPVVASSNVPDEAKITKEYRRLALTKSSKRWAEFILQYKDISRKNNLKIVKDSGYDIDETSEWISRFYLNLI